MAEPIRVDFQVGGIKDVLEAFRTVTKAAKEFGDQVNATATARSRGNAKAQAEGQTLSRDEMKRAREYDAYQKRLLRERSTYVQRQAIADQRTQTNEAKRAARERSRAEEAESRRGALAVVRGFINAEKEKTRAFEREEKNRLRATEAANRQRAQRAQTIASRIVGSASGAISTVGTAAGTVTGLLGGFTVADSVQKGIDARGAAATIAVQSGGAIKKEDILKAATDISSKFGVEITDVIRGLDQFIAVSGDYANSLQGLSRFTELATATGTSIDDLMRTAGNVHNASGKDINLTYARMLEAAGFGRAAAVDLRELAEYMSRISGGIEDYGDKKKAFTGLNIIVQQARLTGGATGAAEATEGITRLGTQFNKRADQFAALGINVKDSSGKFLRDPVELIKETLLKTKGDAGLLEHLFGEQAYRAVKGYQAVYNRAGGGQAGLDEVQKQVDFFANQALKEAQVREEAAKRVQEIDKQLAIVMSQLREQVASQIIPVLVELVPTFRELIPKIVEAVKQLSEFASWFAKNPMQGLGLTLTGLIVKDIAGAGIGSIVASAISSAIAGGTGAAAAAGAAGAAGAGAGGAAAAGAGAVGGGLLATLGTGIGVASVGAMAVGSAIAAGTGYMFGSLYSDAANEDYGKSLSESGNRSTAAMSLVSEARRQSHELSLDPAERAYQQTQARIENEGRAKKIRAMIEREEESLKRGPGTAMGAVMTALASTRLSDRDKLNQEKEDAMKAETSLREQTLKDLRESLNELTRVMNEANGKAPNQSVIRPPQTTVPMSSPLRASP